jgi:transposase-like protein
MTLAHQADLFVPSATCPLCQTVDLTVTAESLRAGATWVCTRCSQIWSERRLETVAAYERYTAAHQAPSIDIPPAARVA